MLLGSGGSSLPGARSTLTSKLEGRLKSGGLGQIKKKKSDAGLKTPGIGIFKTQKNSAGQNKFAVAKEKVKSYITAKKETRNVPSKATAVMPTSGKAEVKTAMKPENIAISAAKLGKAKVDGTVSAVKALSPGSERVADIISKVTDRFSKPTVEKKKKSSAGLKTPGIGIFKTQKNSAGQNKFAVAKEKVKSYITAKKETRNVPSKATAVMPTSGKAEVKTAMKPENIAKKAAMLSTAKADGAASAVKALSPGSERVADIISKVTDRFSKPTVEKKKKLKGL